MIRAADDYDAIHAAVQQLRGQLSSEVDVQWYERIFSSGAKTYGYKAVSERAKSSFDVYVKGEDGLYMFSVGSTEVKKILHIETFLFEEVPAP